MAKSIVLTSDYSDKNTLKIFQKDDGDIVISTNIQDPEDSAVIISTEDGGTRLNHSTEIIQHFMAILNLLSDGTQREDIVQVFS